jgi:ribosomal protein S18 acetylase RimI-like enzyme
MHIRKFENADQAELIAFWKKVFPDDPPHNAPEKIIAAKLAVDDRIFVVENDGDIIGACMAGYDGHRGWLYAVAVDPQYRRTGVGANLVRYALDCLKESGCIKVNLQIRAGNNQVKGFYESLGFETEKRISMGKFLESGT